MKEKLLNNLGLKIISLILAFVVWMAIVNISNPITTDDQDVPLEVRNENALEDADLTYEILGKSTINVKYDVRTRDKSLIKASDFHAYIDLEDYNVTGAIPVTVEISKEKESLIIDKDGITAKPMVIRLATENLQRKQFDLGVISNGTPEEGYALGNITLSPESIWVQGPESEIGQISSMGVEIDVEGSNVDLSGKKEPFFYDANGKKLELSEKVILTGASEISYTVTVLKAKNLNLNFEVTGKVADGYRFTGVSCDIKHIPVVGTKSVLASISSLSVSDDKLDITGAASDRTVTLNINDYLPPSTALASDGESTVKVILKIEPLTARVFTLNTADLEKMGARTDYEYSFDQEKIEVTVEGLEEDLDALEGKNLNAVLDVEDMTPGVHPGVLRFTVGEGFAVTGYTEFQVTAVSDGENGSTAAADEAQDAMSTSVGETVETSSDEAPETEQ